MLLLTVEVNDETGEVTMQSPPKDVVVPLLEELEKHHPMAVHVERDRAGIAMLLTLSSVVSRGLRRSFFEQLFYWAPEKEVAN